MKRSCFVAVLLTLVGLANANSVSYSASVPLTPTNWATSLSFPLFNDMGGTLTLQSVDITINGQLAGMAQFENTSPSPASVSLALNSILTLKRPNNTNVWVQTISDAGSADVLGFDGVLDFGGSSGATFANLSSSASESVTLISAADLALFTGAGNIFLPLLAKGSLTYDGSSNIAINATSTSGADITVTYNYIPEPATLSLMALSGLALLRRR